MSRSPASSSRTPRSTGTTPPATPKVQKGGRPWWRSRWALLLVIPGFILLLAGILVFFLVFARVPLPADIEVGQTVVLDAAGDPVGTLSSERSRVDVDVTELPDHVRDAVLGAEDRRFYEHGGVSLRGIVRALVSNARNRDITGQGGSTITQQYVKNALLTPEQTLTRKLREAALAIKLERAYSKDEILSFYLSTIYWGRGAYGVESAARTYFGVPADQLTVSQAATLAGIIQSPEGLDPVDEPEAAERRRQFVLDGMLEQGWLDQAEHDRIVAEGLPNVSGDSAISTQGPAAYYLDAVRRELGPVLGDAQLYTGLTIRTAMLPQAQAAAQAAVAAAVAEGSFDSGALVAVDPRTGGVVAAVGGPDFATQQLNLVKQGSNQVGSAFKPVTLTRWVTAGLAVESTFPAPAKISVGDSEFRNYGGTSHGEQTVREATVSSTNTVYVQMQQELGGRDVIDTAIAMGLPGVRGAGDEERPAMRPTAGLTLGQDEFTVEEMAGAYATLAAGGVRRTPHLVVEVRDRDGVLLYEAADDAVQAIDENVAAVVTDVLVDVVAGGTGRSAALDGRPVAGKTGTTNDNRDAWFAGYTPQLAAAVWVGNLDDTPVDGLTGGGSAAPVWRAFAEVALADAEVLGFPEPDFSGLELLNDTPPPCPEGYVRQEAPTADDQQPASDGGPQGSGQQAVFTPDVIDDGEELPCVEQEPAPTPTPTIEPTPEPTKAPRPKPKPKPTEDPGLPLPLPSDDPSPTPTDEPTPTEEPTTAPSGEPQPSESPTATPAPIP